jgi:hypothetical protein
MRQKTQSEGNKADETPEEANEVLGALPESCSRFFGWHFPCFGAVMPGCHRLLRLNTYFTGPIMRS